MILVNHELKTPLTSILNFGALLAETKLDEEQTLFVDRIRRSGDRLKILIDDVLLVVKAETGQLKSDVRPMTLELVLRDYLAALQREGFKLAVVVTGHGGTEHVQVLREVCQRDWGDMKVVLWPGAHAGPELPASLRIKHEHDTGHADVFEASIVGGIDPSLVDRAAFGVSERDRKAGLLKENAGAIDFEKGRGIIDYNAAQLAAKVTELLGESKR